MSGDELLILRPTPAKPITRVEIARSFSFKQNLGNYQMADHFCSCKMECDEEEAEDVSERLYQFCRRQVEKSVLEVKGKERKTA